MIKCAYCQHKNVEGSLFCEDCGFAIWKSEKQQQLTAQINNDVSDTSVKAGWGTSTFQEGNEIVVHIRDAGNPILINMALEEVLFGRVDEASGTKPTLDLSPHGGLEKGVSRIHAAIRRGEGVISLVDLDSSNGTYLNGQRLASHQPRILRDGDEVRMGKLIMHIYFK